MRPFKTTLLIHACWLLCLPVLALFVSGCPSQNPPVDPNPAMDADDDGVADADDDCPNTVADADVDANGCAASQRDSDNDGVNDDVDACPDTVVNENVDENGCATGQLDADNDGVANDNDECADTPLNTTVDADGCPIAPPGDPDADGDGVGDSVDMCANTPEDAEVDRVGCAASQRDTDKDGVNDDMDRCEGTTAGTVVDARGCPVLDPGTPDADEDGIADANDTCANTPADSVVDANGCAASQRDTDGDGVNDDLDQCPGTVAGAVVNSVGCVMGGGGGGGGAVCGNGTVETGEECDPPNDATCDANCRNTTGGALANNVCTSPTAVGNGVFTFSTVGATTDGPDEPGQCVIQNYTQVDSDVWYCYSATSTEQVVISLCGSQYDTKMVVYQGCDCPTAGSQRLACSDDDCGTGTDSRTIINAIDGVQYMIRIGGFEGETSDGGVMTIFPMSDPARGTNACNATAGGCFAAHANPGCDTSATCTATCSVDQFCCDREWDSVCATKADGIANGFDSCGAAGAESCFDPSNPNSPTTGCDNQACCQAVCENDPFCCLTEWDSFCADSVGENCGLFAACENTTATCFAQHAGPGCSLTACCNMVCQEDPFCCGDSGWDDVCVDRANALRTAGMCLP